MMEQKKSDDALYSELLTTTPVDTPIKSEDDATIKGTGASPNGEGLSTTMSSGLHQREAYCLQCGHPQHGLCVCVGCKGS